MLLKSLLQIIFILQICFVYGNNDFQNYDLTFVKFDPLTLRFQGSDYHVCPLYYYDDISQLCRQQGYQATYLYKQPTLISTTCDNSNEYGIFLDCYPASYSGSNINECNNLYLQSCQNQCFKLVCQNYKCNEQISESHDCQTCIGTAASQRTPPACECPDGFVDMYPVHEDCQAESAETPLEGELKLEKHDGENILKIYHKHEFKPICGGYNFDEVAATVACNQMGSNSYLEYKPISCPQQAYTGTTTEEYNQYIMDYSTWFYFHQCSGDEKYLEDCQREQYTYQYCLDYDSYCISLTCFELPEGDGKLRLDGGVTGKQSIVEIYHYNFDTQEQEWRPVCDYSINDNLAHVMCVQQGFKTFKTYFGGQECPLNNENGDGTIFWFGRLICKGTETNVTKCRYPDTWVQEEIECKCILLQCTNDYEQAIEGSVRISNNALEIYHDSKWGQVCTNKSLENIGKVVCKQLRKTVNNTVAQKIDFLHNPNSEKQQYVCPNYTNFWVSDIDCPSGNESSLASCNINSEWGKHTCKKTDCIYIACDGEEDISSLRNYTESDIKLNDDGIVMIYHNNIWKPISDSGDEYDPQNGFYGQGINKASAHVICKQMGNATYKKFELKQNCGNGFDGYWLGNIRCKGDEINLVDCYHMPWGETRSGDSSNDCVKIECSADQTCVGENKVTLSKYPYCACQDGYYEDGLQADCLKCSDHCKTCIFSADNCLECSDEWSNFKVLNYQKWYEQQGISYDVYESENEQEQDVRRFLNHESGEGEGCDQYNCCKFSEYCMDCDDQECFNCYNYDDPYFDCNSYYYDSLGEGEGEGQEDEFGCYQISPFCHECDLQNFQCTKCQLNYDPDTNCMYLYPDHHPDAPCVHISEDCQECKGDYCYDCQAGYLSDYNCYLHQDEECKAVGDHCLMCDPYQNECFECEPNYDIDTNCNELLPVGHYMAPCLEFSPYCLDCNESKCIMCIGTWDPKYNCQTKIPVSEQCLPSGCDNCSGYFCSDEVYVDDNQSEVIVEFEQQTTYTLEELNFEQQLMSLSVDANGQLVAPTEEFIDSWGIYFCNQFCAVGYYKESEDVCEQCSGKCQVCENEKDNCIICKYQNNQYVGKAPSCNCLPGSRIVGDDCEPCEPGFYNFEVNSYRCSRCPENADCLGGNNIFLNEGYWRQSQQSADIEWCQNNESACLGGTKTGEKEQCLEGHKGALCEVCDLDGSVWGEKYSNSADFECAKCSLVDNNTLKIIGINVLQFISMFLSVNGTIAAVQDKIKFNSLKSLFNTHEPTPDESGVLMKILNNYLFILGVLTTFQLELPSEIRAFNSGVSNPTKQMSHSFDCFLDSLQLSMPVLYLKVFWQIIIGLLQLLFVFIVIGIGKKAKKIVTPIKSAIFTTIIYQFISMQPGVITMILETIACREIAGENYILSNTSKKCSGTEYYAYTFSIMLPLFLIAGGLIPLLFYRGLKGCYNYDLEKDQDNNKSFKYIETYEKQDSQANGQQQDQQNEQPKKGFFANYFHKRKLKKEEKRKEKEEKKRQKEFEKKEKELKKQEKKQKKKEKQKEKKEKPEDDNDQILDRQKEISKRKPKENYLDRAVPLGKYGYLYLEYKNQVYWWEFVKIYQRLLIAMTLAFYYNDIKVKGIIIFMIVFFYTVLSIRYKPYRLETHNRIDVISGTVTGVSLILGIFIYQNDYPEWVIIAAIIMFALNIYFIILMVSKIAYGKAKNFVTKTNIKIEQQEQIALFDDQMKERKKIIGDLKEKENKKTLLVNEDNFKNDEKVAELEKEISSLNKQMIQIEELLFSLEYLPKKKVEELQKEIEELPSFILHRGFEENIIQERELKLRHSKLAQKKYQEIEHDHVEDNISKISEENEEDSPTKKMQNQPDQDKQTDANQAKQNDQTKKVQSQKIELQKIDQDEPVNDDCLTQKDDQPTKQPQNQQKPMVNDYEKPLETEKDEDCHMIKNQQIEIDFKTKERSRNSFDGRRSSIMNKKINHLDHQFTMTIRDETDNFASLSKKSKIKSRQQQSLSIQNKDEYTKFHENREKQKKLKKTNCVVKGIQKGGEAVLSLFIGKTNSEDMRKAKFLRQMIKFYFKNLIVDGYLAGCIRLASIDDEKQKKIQKNTYIQDSQFIVKYPINSLLKGNLANEDQQVLYINIQEHKKFKEWLNQQILQKVGVNYAKRLKYLKYDKKIWEEKIAENKKAQDQTIENSQSQIQQFSVKQFQNLIDEKVKLYSNKLTDEDIHQEYTAFKLFDIKGKKFVTGDNINEIMLKLNQNISKKVLDRMIGQVDSNDNGEVDFCEFLSLISSKEESDQEKYVIKEIFNYYCSQSNGKLDYLDIDKILRNIYKIKESKSVLKEIIRGIDQHAPETLDIVSFQRLIY